MKRAVRQGETECEHLLPQPQSLPELHYGHQLWIDQRLELVKTWSTWQRSDRLPQRSAPGRAAEIDPPKLRITDGICNQLEHHEWPILLGVQRRLSLLHHRALALSFYASRHSKHLHPIVNHCKKVSLWFFWCLGSEKWSAIVVSSTWTVDRLQGVFTGRFSVVRLLPTYITINVSSYHSRATKFPPASVAR